MSGSTLVNSTSCVHISIIDDDAFEGSHSFSVEVSMVEVSMVEVETRGTDPLLTIGTMSSATIYIEDDDSKLSFNFLFRRNHQRVPSTIAIMALGTFFIFVLTYSLSK